MNGTEETLNRNRTEQRLSRKTFERFAGVNQEERIDGFLGQKKKQAEKFIHEF